MFTFLPSLADRSGAEEPELQWFKGNLHTHSLWSDGDDFPEMIAAWYLDHNYNFLALSDHNVLSQGIRWEPLKRVERDADPGALDRYRARFGNSWVETRGEPGEEGYEVRLKPLDEFRCLVEQAGKFIMITGEEISDQAEGKPVHMNATNLNTQLRPVGGETVRQVIENNLRQVFEHERKAGREVLLHLNHPNFHYAVTAEDLAHVVEEQFYEVYNGHPGVNQLGDADHISIERMWDVANAIRLGVLSAEPLLGIATDDSHEYHGQPGARPGRGWVMVRARYLTPEHLIKAMKAGQFYASSGVELNSFDFDVSSRTLSVEIAAQPGVQYQTEFVSTLRNSEEPGALPKDADIGKVVANDSSLTPSYTMTGEELYVRARITSSVPHSDPSLKGQHQQAWVQPVGWSIAQP